MAYTKTQLMLVDKMLRSGQGYASYFGRRELAAAQALAREGIVVFVPITRSVYNRDYVPNGTICWS